jgi:hypothetical protein
MPIQQRLTETWTFDNEGTTYTLAPINAETQARAMDAAQAGRLNEALLICCSAGLRSWKNGDETVSRVTPREIERLSLAERAVIGDEIFARCVLTETDQD